MKKENSVSISEIFGQHMEPAGHECVIVSSWWSDVWFTIQSNKKKYNRYPAF